nr:reverse transcriptase domain-containing protein [Tanacetum cinerariifolium]
MRARRQRGRVVEFKDAPNRDRSRVERDSEGRRPSEQRAEDTESYEVNLPQLLVARLRRNDNNELNIPSHVGSYDGKGDPGNYFYLFKGAIRMQKWAMPVARHMFTILTKIPPGYGEMVKKQCIISSRWMRKVPEPSLPNLPTTYKGLMEKTYTWIQMKEVTTNGAPTDHQEGFDSPREILATEKAAKAFEQPPRMLGSIRSRAETPDQRSCKIKETSPSCERNKDKKNKSFPFFKVLKSCMNKKTVQWAADAEEAFQKIKEFIEILPTITAPMKGEAFMMYLAASTESISVVLLADREKPQVSIYFVSGVLQGVELNYPELEKLILALVYAARRLRRYFQAHPIWVLADKPIKKILTRPKKSKRIDKWAIELEEHDIEYKGCNSVKGHVLADFLARTPSAEGENMEIKKPKTINEESTPQGKEYTNTLRFKFETTNNTVEYEALLDGLRIAVDMKVKDLSIFVDSQLVANQVKGISKQDIQ